jgi:glycosyl transferase, family 25
MSGDPVGGKTDFNTYFPVKVCINLDRRADRWRGVSRRFARAGIEGISRFSAIDGQSLERPVGSTLTPGELGCLRSHRAVVERHFDAPRLVIFEDDCRLVPRFKDRFAEFAAQLPDDWHLLLFGDNRWNRPNRIRVSRNVVVARAVSQLHAYALNRCAYGMFIALSEQERMPADDCTPISTARKIINPRTIVGVSGR